MMSTLTWEEEKDSLQSANTRESKSNVPKSAEKKGRFTLLGML
jgi:hypothetical protein